MQLTDSQQIKFFIDVEKADVGCWLWNGTIHHGYGVLNINGKFQQAHRISYEIAKGAIPEGLQLDHLCRIRNCVNPDHLEPVTPRENVLRGIGPCALNSAKTFCIKGHPYNEENTLFVSRNRGSGQERICRICQAFRSKTAYEKKKQLKTV
jgi:hypothetical protein